MMRIAVDSGWLSTASTGHRALGDRFAGMHGAMAETASGAVAAAGDPALGHGIGEAYRVTDESVMPQA
jgi:hypothetical protein